MGSASATLRHAHDDAVDAALVAEFATMNSGSACGGQEIHVTQRKNVREQGKHMPVKSEAGGVGAAVKATIMLRDPIYNVPDQLLKQFYIDSRKGALLKSRLYNPVLPLVLRDLDRDIHDKATKGVCSPKTLDAEEASASSEGHPFSLHSPSPAGCSSPPTFCLPEKRPQALAICESGDSVYVVPSSRFHLNYSGITHMLGDSFSRTKVHKLSCGDIIKLGSMSVLITELQSSKEVVETIDPDLKEWLMNSFAREYDESDQNDSFRWTRIANSKSQSGSEKMSSAVECVSKRDDADTIVHSSLTEKNQEHCCYMCTESYDTPDDPLINPCGCSGGTKYVHLSCLRQWVKRDKQEMVCVVYEEGMENSYMCSVCKSPYKMKLHRLDSGQTLEIFDECSRAPRFNAVVLVASNSE